MAKKIPTGEMLRLACFHAQHDREFYASCLEGCTTPSDVTAREEAQSLAAQLKEYRIKRWGKCVGDQIDESLKDGKTITLPGIAAMHRNPVVEQGFTETIQG